MDRHAMDEIAAMAAFGASIERSALVLSESGVYPRELPREQLEDIASRANRAADLSYAVREMSRRGVR